MRESEGEDMPTHDEDRKPTADELAGMQWWNSLSEAQRATALRDAGWQPSGLGTPSVADAWAHYKKTSLAP
jgi:hypothetical protein